MPKLWVLVAALIWAGVATAADQPQYAPTPAWVKPIAIPTDSAGSGDAAFQIRLQDAQTLFGPDQDQFYSETAYKILSAKALAEAGNVILRWNPETDTLVIHRLNIVRGSQTIDTLAGGKQFTVLRREANLELAILDGTLTATLQLEGLQVGDVVDLAATIQRKDPVFQGRSESFTAMVRPGTIGRFHVREIWPASKPMRWRATDGLGTPTVSTAGGGGELLVDLINSEAPKPPRDAPARFSNTALLEVSQFSSWAEVSGLMDPLYRKASTLAADSPLRLEIDKIKAATGDPKARALTALRLVQEKTRYVFLGMNSGGFVPADADVTWARRFGDCKGKTALLLALLNGLDIDAQPALVNAEAGDGLDARLPVLEGFDHVLVRAMIGGKVYWLDGTRLGDVNLDRIAVPNFHWALPVQASGAVLTKLSPSPFDAPRLESVVRLDASAGLDSPASIHAEHVLRGDDAIELKLALDAISREDADRYMRDYWRREIPWADAKTVNSAEDDANGALTLSMGGSATMDWVRSSFYRDFDIGDSNLGFDTSFKREPGPHQDAPYDVDYPDYKTWKVTITLPPAGASFQLLNGQDVGQTIAGVAYWRRSRIDNGIVTMEASQRSLQPEFAASDAEAAAVALRRLSSANVDVRAVQQVETSSADAADPSVSSDPTGATGFSRRGAVALNTGDYVAAITAFTQAARLEPTVAKHLYNRGVAHFELGQRDLALADFDQALKLDPNDGYARVGRGEIHLGLAEFDLAENDFKEAMHRAPGDKRVVRQITAAYDRDPNPKSQIQFLDLMIGQASDLQSRADLLNQRCWVRATAGQQLDKALSDCDAALMLEPNNPEMLDSRGLARLRLGRFVDAISDYDAALNLRPKQAYSLFGRGLAKLRNGQAAQGNVDVAAAKVMDPTIAIRFAGYGLHP